MKPVHDFLRKAVHSRELIDRYLDPTAKMWGKFDPKLGYVLRNAFIRDGVDGSYTLSRYEEDGPRNVVNFADQPCRINTYGNSFTQGHQVSDGETWQEVLAAHFGEPIQNFGIGGHGVYQAYRRLIHMEETERGAPNLIFNFWGDDHQRSINAWRFLSYVDTWSEATSATMFSGNPWCYARLDPATGDLVEYENPLNTPESLYKLCDEEYVLETYQHDPVVRLLVALRLPERLDTAPIEELGAAVGIHDLDFSSPARTRDSAWWVYNTYSWKVTEKILEKLQRFIAERNKRLLVLLSYPEFSVRELCEGKQRDELAYLDWHPKPLRDFMTAKAIPFIDVMPAHLQEFQQFRLTPKEYTDRYYIGHYNPQGNHFFAYAIKDQLVDWLDPKPPTYQDEAEGLVRFDGYLPG
jgi:hypothetical protein